MPGMDYGYKNEGFGTKYEQVPGIEGVEESVKVLKNDYEIEKAEIESAISKII